MGAVPCVCWQLVVCKGDLARVIQQPCFCPSALPDTCVSMESLKGQSAGPQGEISYRGQALKGTPWTRPGSTCTASCKPAALLQPSTRFAADGLHTTFTGESGHQKGALKCFGKGP